MAAEAHYTRTWANQEGNFERGLILHDSDDKETRKPIIKGLQEEHDHWLCFHCLHMLLTGFDGHAWNACISAESSKTITCCKPSLVWTVRIWDNRYGYVIDFANIKHNFEETNEAYLKELNRFN